MRLRLAAFAAGLAFALAAGAAEAAQTQVPLRKNIDLLSAEELAAYEHAIQILKDRSAANPYDRSGFLWQAWVHNCFVIWQPGDGAPGPHGTDCDSMGRPPSPTHVAAHPGMCEHGKDLFLPWHRAQFYYFEKLVQGADPDGTITDSRGVTGPSTRDVAVPFWNWTRPPSGERYPRALENPDSPLYHADRNHGPLKPWEREFLAEVTSPYAVAALVYEPDWARFAGYPQEAPVGGYGGFESAHHNPMHASYFGGDMADPTTAALDPGFFNFHAYIDLVYQFWLDEHGPKDLTSQGHFLRATQPDTVTPPPGHTQGVGLPSMGRAGLYVDPAELGYGYEVTQADRLPPPDAVMALLADGHGKPVRFAATERSPHARLSGDGLHDPQMGPPTQVASIPVTVPATSDGPALAILARPDGAPDVSFSADFYLHPAGLSLDPANRADRERYVVAALARWGSGGGGHAGHGGPAAPKPLHVDLADPLADLAAAGHAGETWTLTAIVSGPDPAADFAILSLAR